MLWTRAKGWGTLRAWSPLPSSVRTSRPARAAAGAAAPKPPAARRPLRAVRRLEAAATTSAGPAIVTRRNTSVRPGPDRASTDAHARSHARPPPLPGPARPGCPLGCAAVRRAVLPFALCAVPPRRRRRLCRRLRGGGGGGGAKATGAARPRGHGVGRHCAPEATLPCDACGLRDPERLLGVEPEDSSARMGGPDRPRFAAHLHTVISPLIPPPKPLTPPTHRQRSRLLLTMSGARCG